jgi:hypothetical protein
MKLSQEQREQIYNEFRIERIRAGARKRMAKWREAHKGDPKDELKREARRAWAREHYQKNKAEMQRTAKIRGAKYRAKKKAQLEAKKAQLEAL